MFDRAPNTSLIFKQVSKYTKYYYKKFSRQHYGISELEECRTNSELNTCTVENPFLVKLNELKYRSN